MSGIAGIIRFDGAPIEPGLVEKMTAAMAHRGPDGIRHWIKGSVALGHCILCTTPESLEERQPLHNEDESVVLVMDGRVDNWEELRRELLGRGAVLRNRSDAELVLRAYETWGRECLTHIDGDFALVIWNARRQLAFCARDRMGNKPFTYHWDGKTLTFSSELHAILDIPWVAREPNEGMVTEFLAADWHSRDETFWRGGMRLVAAHRMEVGASGPHIEKYWEPDPWATLPFKKEEEYIEYYREILIDTIRRTARSHRAVAFEVSGGLDSSAVFCVAEHLSRKGRLPAPAVEGYTLAFDDDSEANELMYSRAVGQYLGKIIQEISPSELPLSWYAETARRIQEFPGFANGPMHLALYRQACADGRRVLLTGLGGDEWLGGDGTCYAEALARREWRALLDLCRVDARSFGVRQVIVRLMREGVVQLLPHAMVDVLRSAKRLIRAGDQARRAPWLSPRMRSLLDLRREESRKLRDRRNLHPGQDRRLELLSDPFIAYAAERTEQLIANNGMEGRNPLRARAIVEFSFAMPERLRRQGDTDKYLHRRALSGLMPNLILGRKNKAEFSSVVRRQLDRLEKVFMEQIPHERPDWVDPRGLQDLFRVYQNNPGIFWPQWVLWGIYGCNVLSPR